MLAGALALLGYGTTGYLLLGFTLPDAIYMTVMTLTTEGFSTADRLGPGGKVFTASLALFGVGVFVAVLGLIGTALLEGRFGPGRRRRRMDRHIETMREHFIVCAYGRVGRAVARELEAEHIPFLIIDSKSELEPALDRDKVPYLIDDAASEPALRHAGIDRARGLICAVDSDAENIYITLIARSLNPTIAIVARASQPESAERLIHAGATSVVSPYLTSGRRMALHAVRPHVGEFLEFTRRGTPDARLEEIRIDPHSHLLGQPLKHACPNALPLLIHRADDTLIPNPSPDTTLNPGDTIIVFGDPTALQPLENE